MTDRVAAMVGERRRPAPTATSARGGGRVGPWCAGRPHGGCRPWSWSWRWAPSPRSARLGPLPAHVDRGYAALAEPLVAAVQRHRASRSSRSCTRRRRSAGSRSSPTSTTLATDTADRRSAATTPSPRPTGRRRRRLRAAIDGRARRGVDACAAPRGCPRWARRARRRRRGRAPPRRCVGAGRRPAGPPTRRGRRAGGPCAGRRGSARAPGVGVGAGTPSVSARAAVGQLVAAGRGLAARWRRCTASSSLAVVTDPAAVASGPTLVIARPPRRWWPTSCWPTRATWTRTVSRSVGWRPPRGHWPARCPCSAPSTSPRPVDDGAAPRLHGASRAPPTPCRWWRSRRTRPAPGAGSRSVQVQVQHGRHLDRGDVVTARRRPGRPVTFIADVTRRCGGRDADGDGRLRRRRRHHPGCAAEPVREGQATCIATYPPRRPTPSRPRTRATRTTRRRRRRRSR